MTPAIWGRSFVRRMPAVQMPFFLSKGSVDLYNPKVLRATMGSLFHVPVFQNIDLHALSEKMQAKQIPLYAAHLKGNRYPYALPLQDACAFLIGNEARGLSEDAAALCDAWVKNSHAGAGRKPECFCCRRGTAV